MTSLEVLFAPAEFEALTQRDLSQTVCVVFDVLRATSSMVTALAHGAKAIIPVGTIEEALEVRRRNSSVLLAGEREGLRIRAAQTGGVDFDLGNSPLEFTAERVDGRTIVTTTTNGTRALRACSRGRLVLAGAFLNLRATAERVRRENAPRVLVICAGTHDQAATEDILAAGALCHLLWQAAEGALVSDSSHIARELFLSRQADLAAGLGESRNGRRLLALPDLAADVAYCAQCDCFPLVAELTESGEIKQSP